MSSILCTAFSAAFSAAPTELLAAVLANTACCCSCYSVCIAILPANFSLSMTRSPSCITLHELSGFSKSLSKSKFTFFAASLSRGSNTSGSFASRVYTTAPPYPTHASFSPR